MKLSPIAILNAVLDEYVVTAAEFFAARNSRTQRIVDALTVASVLLRESGMDTYHIGLLLRKSEQRIRYYLRLSTSYRNLPIEQCRLAAQRLQ